jgi:hypothetical protein
MEVAEQYICQIHCTRCKKMLKQSDPVAEADMFKNWEHIYQTAPQAAARVQQSINCACLDGTTGKGAPVQLAVWACISRMWCDMVMKAPMIKDFKLMQIVKGIKISN